MKVKRRSGVAIIPESPADRDFESLLRQASAYLKAEQPRLMKVDHNQRHEIGRERRATASTVFPKQV